MEQPKPKVSHADVERVIRRDFEPGDVEQVVGLVGEVSSEFSPRVALAVLRLAEGSVERLHTYLRVAREDWRDVIASAEYPNYAAKVPGAGALSEAHRAEIIQADWDQYSRWLNR